MKISKHFIWLFGVLLVLSVSGIFGFNVWSNRTTPEKIAAGNELFVHDWSENDPLSEQGDGLGPVFNARSCVDCHFQGGIGGGGGNGSNVVSYTVRPDSRIGRREVTSGVVHAEAVSDELRETIELVKSLYPEIPGQTLMGGDCAYTTPPINPVVFTEINTPHLFGAGLIDDISSSAIAFYGTKRMAKEVTKGYSGFYSGNGTGRTQSVNGFIGKFGWKGQFASLEDFVAAACANEMGLTNPLRSQMVAKKFKEDKEANLDMSRKQLNELVCFVRNLPRPEQILPVDPELRERAISGEELFVEVGCSDCHVKNIGGVEGIYSDFHLYRIESSRRGSYFRGEAQSPFEMPDSEIQLDHWKTPALWGVADTAPYFHDGASATLRDAILRHDGQARHTMKMYKKLSSDEQTMIVEFLETLRTPASALPVE